MQQNVDNAPAAIAGSRASLGVDVGGTFTDIVLRLADGRLFFSKVSSTPDDPGEAVRAGVVAILKDAGLDPSELGEIVHGTTVGSNAILQRKGAKTGLITTRGFRDVLEIARIRTPTMFDLSWAKPEPLVPRRYRMEVNERMGADGQVIEALDEESLRVAVDRMVSEGIEAIALCFINSYVNPAHEIAARDWIQSRHPGLALTASYEVLQEIKEYERTSTTVVNAYLLKEMRTYLTRLTAGLKAEGIQAPLLVMSSSGGIMGAAAAADKPVFVVGSGPAGGVTGAAHLARRGSDGINIGSSASAIAFDMGGTTAKASIVENGMPMLTSEYEFRDGISSPSRFVKGGGYMLKVPAIDIAEVGAGGGSIAWIDDGGLLRVGPQSAGAAPGPACYGLGNDRPTVTDANVALGYFNPASLAGGSLSIDPALSAEAIRKYIAEPLGLSVDQAALGIRQVSNVSMSRALRAVTVERGRDPRDLALIAFGGSGPAHAVDLARQLGIGQVILPPLPGVFSAVGMLASDVEHSAVKPLRGRLDAVDADRVDSLVAALKAESLSALEQEGFPPDACDLRLSADLRYLGQSSELSIPCPLEPFTPALAEKLRQDFMTTYHTTFGCSNDEPVDLVGFRMVAAGRRERQLDFANIRFDRQESTADIPARQALFDANEGRVSTPVIARSAIGADWRHGPLIVESYDTTVVVPPIARIRADISGSLIIEPNDEAGWYAA